MSARLRASDRPSASFVRIPLLSRSSTNPAGTSPERRTSARGLTSAAATGAADAAARRIAAIARRTVSVCACRVAPQDSRVAHPPRQSVRVESLEEQLGVAATHSDEIAEAAEGDAACGFALSPQDVDGDLEGARTARVAVTPEH